MGFRLLSSQELPTILPRNNSGSIKEQRQHSLKASISVEGQMICFCADDPVNSFVLAKRILSDAKIQAINSDNESVAKMIADNTDLVSGIYEGGLKTWEASYDLVKYLKLYLGETDIRNFKVLELGCGSALPGCFCLSRGAHVDFQDFNEVIRLITPRKLLNT